eukprot:gnl/MRDRNA2_/MRDRNA2_21668_c0_seq1.p1 gnl/MRDRNA2_/MRDRNA2_21668_c0~~gnl/MRDRNA2_/MRDRNA2_21668_c0_seq1.p1  ORF type:complete len:281 (+),score=39.47 gnl/MRDRNA2_/MRDRNA2_21668_c0_seq1:90-845(+)
MFAEARQMGSIWFWLFQIVLVLLMLNMLLAIIMDTYSEVKAKSGNHTTLPEQLFILIRRWQWIRRGEGLPLEKIEHKLGDIFGNVHSDVLKGIDSNYKWKSEEIITVSNFVKHIKDLGNEQAERLVTLAVRNWRLENLEPLSLTEAMNLISLIHRHLLDQSRTLAQIHFHLSVDEHGDVSNEAFTSRAKQKIHVNESLPEVSADRIDSLETALKTTNSRLDSMEQKFDTVQTTLNRIEDMLQRGEQRSLRL